MITKSPESQYNKKTSPNTAKMVRLYEQVSYSSHSSLSHLPVGKRSWLPGQLYAGQKRRPGLRATALQTLRTRCTPPAGVSGAGQEDGNINVKKKNLSYNVNVNMCPGNLKATFFWQ